MPRIRTVKPEFWADEKLAPMDPITRLVFLGLISMADDAGRLVDSVKQIDAFLFAFTEDSSREALANLSRTGRIVRGTTKHGQAIIQITNWHHQKVDHPNLSAALPPIAQRVTEDSRGIRENGASDSRGIRDSISTSTSTSTKNLREGAPSAHSRAHPREPRARPAPPAWASRLADRWVSRVGAVTLAAVKRHLAKPVEQRGEDAILRAMDSWLDARKGNGKDPVLKWFAEVAVAWADRVNTPVVDPDTGIPTERGMAILAGTGA